MGFSAVRACLSGGDPARPALYVHAAIASSAAISGGFINGSQLNCKRGQAAAERIVGGSTRFLFFWFPPRVDENRLIEATRYLQSENKLFLSAAGSQLAADLSVKR